MWLYVFRGKKCYLLSFHSLWHIKSFKTVEIFSVKKGCFGVLHFFSRKSILSGKTIRLKYYTFMNASLTLRSSLNIESLQKTTGKATKSGFDTAFSCQEKCQNKANDERSDEYGCNVSVFLWGFLCCFFLILAFRKQYIDL